MRRRHAAHACARGFPACGLGSELGLVVNIARAGRQLLGDPDRGARFRQHRVAVERGRARVDEAADARLARRREEPLRRADVHGAKFRAAARREVGHVQGRRVDHRVNAREERREPRRILDVHDLRRERSGPQIDAGDRMPEREPRGDGAADPARRAGDEDLHVVLKLTRRPTRQVSS